MAPVAYNAAIPTLTVKPIAQNLQNARSMDFCLAKPDSAWNLFHSRF
jgi:hypothetical protein